MAPTGFRFEKPRPGNPCGAWAAGDYRGIRGFISTTRKFFKNNHPNQLDHQGHEKKYFQRPKKTLKPPKTPFLKSGHYRQRCPLSPHSGHRESADFSYLGGRFVPKPDSQ
jgi:hypothetical protein